MRPTFFRGEELINKVVWKTAWYWKGTLIVSWIKDAQAVLDTNLLDYKDVPDYEALFFVDDVGNTLELRRLGDHLALNALTAQHYRGTNRFGIDVRGLADHQEPGSDLKGKITQIVFAQQISKDEAKKHYAAWKAMNCYIQNKMEKLLERLPSSFSG